MNAFFWGCVLHFPTMNFFSFYKNHSHLYFRLTLFIILFLNFSVSSHATKILADNLIFSTPGHTRHPNRALVEPGFSTLRANPGLALGVGKHSAVLELGFDEKIPARTPVYVRINGDENFLSSLLGGSLGKSLLQTLGNVMIGNQVIEIELKDAHGNTVFKEDSESGFRSTSFRLVINSQGEYFLRVIPPQDFQRIRIHNKSGSLIGTGISYSLDVYYAFYHQVQEACDLVPLYTSFEGNGMSLDLLRLNPPISELQYAIDEDFMNTYSSLSLGILSTLGAESEQIFYFDQALNPNKNVLVNLKISKSLLDLGILNNIQIISYSNGVSTQQVQLSSFIDLDLLGLFGSDEIIQFPIAIDSAPIDQLGVKITSLVNLGLVNDHLGISGLYVVPKMPEPDFEGEEDRFRICQGDELRITPQLEHGLDYLWYKVEDDSILFIGEYDEFDVPENLPPGLHEYALRSRYQGCSQISIPWKFEVEVIEKSRPEEILIEPSNEVSVDANGVYQYREGLDDIVLTPSLPNMELNSTSFFWFLDEAQSQPIFDGMLLDNILFQLEPNGELTITNMPYIDPSDPFFLYVNYAGPGNCPASSPRALRLNSIIVVLGIELEEFHSKINDSREIEIFWKLTNLKEEHSLILEKANQSLQWTEAFRVSGKNQENGKFVDKNPWPNFNFYRVKVESELGKTLFVSSVISIKAPEIKEQSVKVYPTVFEDKINVDFPFSSEKAALIQLVSHSGETLITKEISLNQVGKKIEVNHLNFLPSGSYIIIIYFNNIKTAFHIMK